MFKAYGQFGDSEPRLVIKYMLRRLRRTGALHSLQEAVIDGIAAYHITRLPELHRSLLINVTTCTVILCTGPHGTVLP